MKKKTLIVCGIDIGGTNTVFGLIDLKGNILYKDSFSTNANDSPESYIGQLSRKILSETQKRKDEFKLVGIGIGAPNGNYYTGEMIDPPNFSWGTIPLAEMISSKLGVPCALTNDANAAALGEMKFGAAKEMKDFAVITLGTGLGSGLVVNQKVVYGKNGHAGELGHCIVKKNGRKCSCGLKGCLEAYVSASGILRTVKHYLKREPSSLLSEVPRDELCSKDIYVAALQGDKIAQKAFLETGEILGEFLATTVCHFHPEAIFLLGGLTNAGELLFDPVIEAMERNLLSVFKGQVTVIPSGLPGADSAILGAGALAWDAFKK